MRYRIAEENSKAEGLIPPGQLDGSGIGVNYADAYIKAMNVTLTDDLQLSCKRKGLKIMMKIGDAGGEAIMRRIEHGPDVKNILKKALDAAAEGAGFRFIVEAGVMYLETTNGDSE